MVTPESNQERESDLMGYWKYPQAFRAGGNSTTQDGKYLDFSYKAVVDNSLVDAALFYLEKLGVDPEDALYKNMPKYLSTKAEIGISSSVYKGDYCIQAQFFDDHILLIKYHTKKKGSVTVSLTMVDQKVSINLFEVAED